jgi:hypothetical protein
MALQLPNRTPLRRAVALAALGAPLLAPAVAGAAPAPAAAAAKAKAKPVPSVRSVKPLRLAVGDTLEIRGKHFRRGRDKNTVVFQRSGAKAVFVKAGIGTTKLLRIKLPDRLEDFLQVKDGARVATTFRLRVLAARFGKRYTKTSLSPRIGPKGSSTPAPLPPPAADCDGDGLRDPIDLDDDNDLLSDALEGQVNAQQGLKPDQGMQVCGYDSDDDGVGDGFEWRSARDLNVAAVPFPGKKPYANPLFADAGTDYDGDGLVLAEEHRLSQFELARTGRTPTLESLSYSDGTKYAKPDAAAGYDRQADFLAWAAASGRGTVAIPGDPVAHDVRDLNRDGAVSTARVAPYRTSEVLYYDFNRDGRLADNERDEDADGIPNVEETVRHGMDPGYWAALYAREKPFHPVAFKGTAMDDADSDGDGIRDGADDQDFDDVPNLMELSRVAASGRGLDDPATPVAAGNPTPAHGRVNPFNPCLPDPDSRTCPTYVEIGNAWAPFDGPPFDPSGDDPDYLVLN